MHKSADFADSTFLANIDARTGLVGHEHINMIPEYQTNFNKIFYFFSKG